MVLASKQSDSRTGIFIVSTFRIRALCGGCAPTNASLRRSGERPTAILQRRASTGLFKRAHIEVRRKVLSRLPEGCIQLVSAKFGSFAVENRFRQPASPLLTGSDSSQQKIQIEIKEHQWKQEQ